MRVQVAPGRWEDRGPVSLIDSLWPCGAKRRCGERQANVIHGPRHGEVRVLVDGHWRRWLH